ncbi:hypothetical protein [Campylobacter sp. RM12651]|uniref:hypothetical protein n=1 Tax=Campylobacter sp. RM12651 TaxID=1660079 RepID=UPI001EFB42B3|nr:hypothetical protein [Campylobacter sp. RM12651]ULO03788.1 putative membrane protein [Campylobacter sp. RM12651]
MNELINAIKIVSQTHTNESLLILMFAIHIIYGMWLLYFKINELNPSDIYTNKNIVFLCLLQIIFVSFCFLSYRMLNDCIEQPTEQIANFWFSIVFIISLGGIAIANTHRIIHIINYLIKERKNAK